MARKTRSKGNESEILRSLCDYLSLKKRFFWRSNNIPPVQRFGDGSMAFRRLPAYSLKGIPDIIMIDSTGHFIGIEAKGKKGRLSPEQEDFRRRCKENGAEYIVAKSVDDLIEHGL
jgi:hypothetical protein